MCQPPTNTLYYASPDITEGLGGGGGGGGILPHLEGTKLFLSAWSWYFWKLTTIIWLPFNIPKTIADQ